MRKLILIVPIVIVLLGCAQTDETGCEAPYVLIGDDCCLDRNNNNICDFDESTPEEKNETPTQLNESPPSEPEDVPLEQEEDMSLDITLETGETREIGYLPNELTARNISEGSRINFDEAGVEILGVWNNAITTRVFGATIGEKFTVAKDKPVDVYTRDGKIRMDFRDNRVLDVTHIVE